MEEENTNAESIDWRRRFISLAEDVCSARGQPAAAIIDDPDNPLLMKIPVDGVDFDLLHFPDAQERLVVHCRLGAVPEGRGAGMLKTALTLNSSLSFNHAGMFTMDARTSDLTYCTAESLRELSASQLLHNMSMMVASLQPWVQATQRLA